MSWPVEYRVMRVRPYPPRRKVSEWRRHEGGVATIGADWTFYGRGGFAYKGIGTDEPLGRWFAISAAEADQLAREQYQDWLPINSALDYPDGAVDLFSELVCDEGNTVEGRYEPDGPWVKLEPGFKGADVPETSLGHMRSALQAAVSKGGREPGHSEAAYHLVRHQGMRREQRLPLIQNLFPDRYLTLPNMAGYVSDGRKREKRDQLCRFCDFP